MRSRYETISRINTLRIIAHTRRSLTNNRYVYQVSTGMILFNWLCHCRTEHRCQSLFPKPELKLGPFVSQTTAFPTPNYALYSERRTSLHE